MTKDMEKAKVLSAFFTSVFTGKVWNQEGSPSVQVREHLNKLDRHKSMGPEGMDPRVG